MKPGRLERGRLCGQSYAAEELLAELRARRRLRGKKALGYVKPIARADKVIRPRLIWATGKPFIHIVAGLCIRLPCTVPLLVPTRPRSVPGARQDFLSRAVGSENSAP